MTLALTPTSSQMKLPWANDPLGIAGRSETALLALDQPLGTQPTTLKGAFAQRLQDRLDQSQALQAQAANGLDALNQLASPVAKPGASDKFKETFQKSVGSMLYGQMLKALRSGVGKPKYIHGGQTEDLFTAQLDQHVAETLSARNGDQLVRGLYERTVAGLAARNIKA